MNSFNPLCTKKGKSLCFCVPYKRLNNRAQRDSYWILRMEKFICSIGDGMDFSSLNARCGYRQEKFEDEGQNKSVFTSTHSLYRFVRLSFCLEDIPGTFQKRIEVTLPILKLTFCFDISCWHWHLLKDDWEEYLAFLTSEYTPATYKGHTQIE